MKKSAKKFIRKTINKLGYEVTRTPDKKKSVSSKKLSFYKTKTGNYFLPTDAPSDGIASAIVADKIFDENIFNLAKKHIKPGTSVLDVGSNFGQMAILYSNLTGDNGKVYAFDAADFVFEILTKNIAANNKKILLQHLALCII